MGSLSNTFHSPGTGHHRCGSCTDSVSNRMGWDCGSGQRAHTALPTCLGVWILLPGWRKNVTAHHSESGWPQPIRGKKGHRTGVGCCFRFAPPASGEWGGFTVWVDQKVSRRLNTWSEVNIQETLKTIQQCTSHRLTDELWHFVFNQLHTVEWLGREFPGLVNVPDGGGIRGGEWICGLHEIGCGVEVDGRGGRSGLEKGARTQVNNRPPFPRNYWLSSHLMVIINANGRDLGEGG